MLGMLRAALRLRRPPALPAQDQDHPDDQARRLPHPGPPAAGGAARPWRPAPAEQRPRRRRPAAARRTAGRPARHAARRCCSARTSAPPSRSPPGSRRRAPSAASRDPRRARRPRRRPAAGRRRGDRLLVLQRHPARQRRRVLPLDPGAADAAAEGVAYTVFGCGNTEWAATYQAVPTLLDEQLAAHGGRRVRDRGEGNAAGDFDAAYRDWHGALWSDLATALDLPAEVGETAAPDRPAPVDHADQPAGHQPGDRLLRGAAGPGAGEPRADQRP